jgi:hypothetical protein
MAVAGFKGFGWLLCGVVVSPGLYLVTSSVAAERGRVEAVERAIVAAQGDIRDLETEFQTRANFAQLERWNGDVLALASPRPEQYADGEEALASLNPGGMLTDNPQVAALVVPAGIALTQAEVAPASAVAVPVKLAAVAKPVAPTVTAERAPRRPAAKPQRQDVAMLDRKLLDDSTLGDLLKSARAESVRRR